MVIAHNKLSINMTYHGNAWQLIAEYHPGTKIKPSPANKQNG